MPELDPTFTALPLRALADAALDRAAALGAGHVEVRIERTRSDHRTYRDAALESASDSEVLGLGVRLLWQGVWGFAAGITLTPQAAARIAEQAVEVARISAAAGSRPVELAPEPVHRGSWVSAYRIDPLSVPAPERDARLIELSAALLAGSGVDHVQAAVDAVRENKFYADSAGTETTQQRVRIAPALTAVTVGEHGFATMRTLAPPVGRGWEYLTGEGWDFDAEVAELPGLLAEHAAAPSVEPGRYDLVIEPTNLWLTVHESIAHGTELDRALGYEAAYAGTSFATVDGLGSLQYGSPLLQVTGDRVTEHGLASVGWDDEGVGAQEFEIIRDGVLVGYQLNRQMAAERGLGRSNGCAFADAPSHIPLQRMPNVSIRPDPQGPDVAGLISRVERGILVQGDNSWSIDMQRYNFQFTGQRFFAIENGRLVGQLRDVAYQATTTDFWGSLAAVGGPQTYLLAGAMNCGKGQPGQIASVSHGAPACLFREVNVLNTNAEGGAL
ncbi:TldD protein [Propionibacteriaceae bacterium ES.041]|uniref:TldD/PmbA family protein n=1 Tax=Enemella evansiae TaxID=2016499 RepID=UPI000B95D439|nr:TldD/PmbA family protein [Enemella evansiae]OYO00412.1 peptidase C69 [Enemella evansiae]OYO20259.1 peptidase C69 [Enemella evansiae]PFG66876.1 TldD protein [Propionibacteriaceae bacterium ES.041]TDO92740.1 TldD protein [Enemella evansiae]